MTQALFNNREYAIAIWLCVGALFMFPKPKFRKSVLALIKIAFGRKVFPILLTLVAYVALIVFLFAKMHLWQLSMLKETVYWFLGTALVMFTNFTAAGNDEHFFRKKVLQALGFSVILEFVINLYAFSLPVELILFPFLILLVGMIAVAETDAKYAQTKKVLEFVMSALGILLLIYVLVMLVWNYESFFNIATLKNFFLHPLLTIALLPFIYFLALYSVYESFFLRIKFAAGKENPEVATFLKRRIWVLCHLNLRKLNAISRTITAHMWSVKSTEEAATMIDSYLRGTLSD